MPAKKKEPAEQLAPIHQVKRTESEAHDKVAEKPEDKEIINRLVQRVKTKPSVLKAGDVLNFQNVVGNQAVLRMIQRQRAGSMIQRVISDRAQAFLNKLSERQKSDLDKDEYHPILDLLAALFADGFDDPDTGGRIVSRKNGSWEDAQNGAKTHLGATLETKKVSTDTKTLFSEKIGDYTLNVRNFGSEAKTNGTIEIHVAGYIFEFKYKAA